MRKKAQTRRIERARTVFMEEAIYITCCSGRRRQSSRFHKSQKFAFFRSVNHPARMDNMRAQIDRDVPDFLSSGWSARLAF